MKDMRDEALWAAIAGRDASYSGVFYFGVRTTGVYCRPGCPSPTPKKENVVLAFSSAVLASGGYRPCRRCRPDECGRPEAPVAAVVDLCRFIEEADDVPSMAELSVRSGMSASAVSRLFRNALGVTPREYADAHRRARFRTALRSGAGVLDATLEAGYGSSSRAYEGVGTHLGMTPKAYRDGARGQRIAYAVHETPMGMLVVATTDRGICSVKLGDEGGALLQQLRLEFPEAELHEADAQLGSWMRMLIGYLSGRLPWPELPYDVRATAFQRRVWEHLRAIPPGETRHYSEIAEALGQPSATRAVARACAANPVALVVPCHRVVPKSRGLAGFRWGIRRKRWLLQLEGSPAADR